MRPRASATVAGRSLLDIARTRHAGPTVAELATGQGRATAAAGSAAAHAAGDAWEDAVRAASQIYRRLGLGLVEKLNPALGGPPGRMFLAEPSTVDCLGYLRSRSGRPVPVAFDAKSYTGRADLCLVPDRVPTDAKALQKLQRERERAKRQCAFLRDFAAQGDAVACFLVRCSAQQRVWCVSGAAALGRLEAGAAVPLRTFDPARRIFVHHWPSLGPSSDADVARGRPRWDYRVLLTQAFPDLFAR